MTLSSPSIRRSSLAAVPTALTALLATGGNAQAAQIPTLEIDSAGVRTVTIDPFASDAVCSVSEEPTFYVGDSEESDEQWFTRVLGAARLSDGIRGGRGRLFHGGAHLRPVGRARPLHGKGRGGSGGVQAPLANVASAGGHAVGGRLPALALPGVHLDRGVDPDGDDGSDLPEREPGGRRARERCFDQRAGRDGQAA